MSLSIITIQQWPDILRKNADAMDAALAGKDVEFLDISIGKWQPEHRQIEEWGTLTPHRLKLEPVSRPWSKPDDVKSCGPLLWMRASVVYHGAMIVGIDDDGVWTNGGDQGCHHEWATIARCGAEYSKDLKTWSKCEVIE